jgi:4-hydroxy-3-methylbut-2-enyl diphosphate reductase
MVRRYGAEDAASRFAAFDTICSATQDRQDALHAMLRDAKVDLMLVIGGYNSSNTGHLVEIASEKAPTYHIQSVDCVESAKTLRHLPLGQRAETSIEDWLPEGPLAIGVTAGASTPNSEIDLVIRRVCALRGIAID